MAPFYASIWALIEEKGIKGVITTRKKAREFFLKKIVAVDGLNQGHNGGRAHATFAEQRTNLGRRLIKICLLGARPVVFLDGQHASPGAGKTKQHAARARRPPRFTTFPRGILPPAAGGTARSAKDAYRWASGQFGGGLLPSIDSDRGKKILKRFVEIRALSKKGQL